MSNPEIQETERADLKLLTTIIRNNCKKFDLSPTIPSDPWFLKTQNQASSILSSILTKCNNDVKEFSRDAAKAILKYRALEEEHNMLKASHLLESLEINKAFETVRSMNNSSTLATIKLARSQSTKGPVSLKLKLPNKENIMEEGDTVSIVVMFSDVIPVEYLLDDGESVCVIESDLINIRNITEGIGYMSVAQRPELKKDINRKGIDYEVRIEIRLKLSVKDRVAILSKRNVEVEKGIQESNESIAIYNCLMDSLLVQFNQDSGEFESIVRGRKEDREGCCENCVVV